MIKHWVKFHIPKVLPSILCGQLRISWNSLSPVRGVWLLAQSLEGTRMRRQSEAQLLCLLYFLRIWIHSAPQQSGAETNKLCAPEEVSRYQCSSSRWEVFETPNLILWERWDLPKMGEPGTASSFSVCGGLPFWSFSPLPSFWAPFCIQIPANSQTPQGWELSLKAKVKDLIKSGNAENRMNRNEALSATPQRPQ